MSVTAWKTSQTQNNEAFGDGNAWSNLSNITASDDQYATCSIAKNEASDYLNATNFGFSIPSTATIQGIEVQIELKSDTADTTSDQTIQLLVNGSRSGDNKAISDSYPTSDTTRNYGGTADTWGLNLTPADVNSTDFGISIQSYSSGGASTAYIDYVSIRITYSENGITVIHDTKVKVKTNIKPIFDTSTCISQQGDNVLNAQGEYTGGATLDGDEKFSWYNAGYSDCDNSIYIQDMNLNKENGKTYYAVFEPQNVCVPDTAEINGIEAIIRQRTYTSGQVVYEDVFKLYDGSDFSGNKADTNHQLPESYEDRTIGSPTDTWGLTITPDNIQDIDLYLKYNITNNSNQVSDIAIDCVSFKIYYTIGGTSYTQTHDTSAKIITTISNIQDTKSVISSQYSINQDTKEITKTIVSSVNDTSIKILNLVNNLQDTQANISLLTSAIHDTNLKSQTSIKNTFDISAEISNLYSLFQDTKVIVSSQVTYTQIHDTLAVVRNTIETLQDTYLKIITSYQALNDTSSKVSSLLTKTQDTKSKVSLAVENIYDTTAQITTLIKEISDTLSKITTLAEILHDTRIGVSTQIEQYEDTKTKINKSIDETFDTLINLSNLTDQFHDTEVQVSLPVIETYHDMKAEITTSIAKLIDSKAFVSNLYENLADTFALIKTKRIAIHDTSLSITTQLNKLFDSYAQVSSLFERTQDTKTVAKFSIEEYFDSYARVTTEILNRAGLEADVSTKIDLSQDTKVIGKTLLVHYPDTQLKCIDHPIVSKLFRLAERLDKIKKVKHRQKVFRVLKSRREDVFKNNLEQ